MYTEKNHESMKTIVETFVTEETASLIYDNEQLDKWTKLVQELDLQGQSAIKNPDKSPIPFMYLKRGLLNIFRTLCPVSTSVELYSKTPIPLEILELIALSKKENYFDTIEVWYDDQTPDPVVVGMKSINPLKSKTIFGGGVLTSVFDEMNNTRISHFSENNFYLIGKWGDVKQDFDELKERAKKRYSQQLLTEVKRQASYLDNEINMIEIKTAERFS